MSKHYLAFDLGASSGRAIVGTLESGKLQLTEVHRFANAPYEKDGSLHWDFASLCRELEAGLGKALKQFPDVRSMAVDTWGVDYVLFRNGRPVADPFNYRDERTGRIRAKVDAAIPPAEQYRRTGIQHMDFNTIYQLAAHLAERPEELQGSTFLMMPDALEYMLGGEFKTEYTHASTSNLLSLKTGDWDWELVDRLGLSRTLFPAIVQPCTHAGFLKKELQERLNAPAIPILKIGSHDTASAVASAPVKGDGPWAYISCGTWALLGSELSAPCNTAQAEQAVFTNEGGLNRTTRFLTNIMGCWLLQQCRNFWRSTGVERSFGEMAQMAAEAPFGAFLLNPNDALFVAPGDMPSRIRQYCERTGQGAVASDGALLRAVYDSLALCFADKLADMEQLQGHRSEALHILGGGTQDAFLMQSAADATGLAVTAGPIEATCAGNLLAQALTMGDLPDGDSLRQVVRSSFPVVTYQPDAEMHRKFQETLKRFQQITKGIA